MSFPTYSMPYIAGNVTVDVAVRNRAMNLIPDAKVTCYLSDSSHVYLKARAAGYITQKKIIDIKPNQTLYKYDFVLLDEKRTIYITDRNGYNISSAYVRLSQVGYPANRYGMTVYIPVKSISVITEKDVDIIDPLWGLPYKHDFKIETDEEFHKVNLSISRKAYSWAGPEIIIIVNTSKSVELKTVKKLLNKLEKLDKSLVTPPNATKALTEYIIKAVPAEMLTENNLELPRCLDAYLKVQKKFNSLHKNIQKK